MFSKVIMEIVCSKEDIDSCKISFQKNAFFILALLYLDVTTSLVISKSSTACYNLQGFAILPLNYSKYMYYRLPTDLERLHDATHG